MSSKNNLKKLRRKDLLEILVLQNTKINTFEEEIKALKAQIEKRQIILSEVGNIAEASLKLNKIFETAQIAADEYLESIKYMAKSNNKKIKGEYNKKVVIIKEKINDKENI